MGRLRIVAYLTLAPLQLWMYFVLLLSGVSGEAVLLYLPSMFVLDMTVALFVPPLPRTSALWFVALGGIATLISLNFPMTLGAITIWTSMSALALGIVSLVRPEADSVHAPRAS